MSLLKNDEQSKLKRQQAGAKALGWLGQGLRGGGLAVNWVAQGLADLSEKGSKQLAEKAEVKTSTPKNG